MKMDDKPKPQEIKGTSFVVKQDQTLVEFLSHVMQGRSRTSIRELLQKGAISVDGVPLRRLDDPLKAGSTVFVGKKPDPVFPMPQGLRIIWEDRYLILVKKEHGLLTVGNRFESERTAEEYLNEYMQFKKEGDKVYIVHRIDRDTSGVLMFAKDSRTQQLLRTNWNEVVEERRYIAVVEGYIKQSTGTIDTWIEENKQLMKMFVCRPGKGKRAITHFKVIGRRNGYSLLELELETGRKNQIRIHMSHIGHPVAGDEKYGAQTNPCGRLCLHAQQIEFTHPITGENMEFTSEVPREFLQMFEVSSENN